MVFKTAKEQLFSVSKKEQSFSLIRLQKKKNRYYHQRELEAMILWWNIRHFILRGPINHTKSYSHLQNRIFITWTSLYKIQRYFLLLRKIRKQFANSTWHPIAVKNAAKNFWKKKTKQTTLSDLGNAWCWRYSRGKSTCASFYII